MKIWFLLCIVGLVFVAGACTNTFLVYKDGRGVFLGGNMKAKYDVLCESGDLEKVLAVSNLSKEMKDALYKYNCSAERSNDQVRQIYASMTPEQRKDIKSAFRKNGFTINMMAG